MKQVANFVFDSKSIEKCTDLNNTQKEKLERALKRKLSKARKPFLSPPNFKNIMEEVYNSTRSYAKTSGSENSTGGGCQPLDIKGVENISQQLIKNFDKYASDAEEKIIIFWVCEII
jgi:hypothetical protein